MWSNWLVPVGVIDSGVCLGILEDLVLDVIFWAFSANMRNSVSKLIA